MDPTVMAQQIQALTANVKELMKQNEELKWRARNDNDDKAYSPENSRRDTSDHTM